MSSYLKALQLIKKLEEKAKKQSWEERFIDSAVENPSPDIIRERIFKVYMHYRGRFEPCYKHGTNTNLDKQSLGKREYAIGEKILEDFKKRRDDLPSSGHQCSFCGHDYERPIFDWDDSMKQDYNELNQSIEDYINGKISYQEHSAMAHKIIYRRAEKQLEMMKQMAESKEKIPEYTSLDDFFEKAEAGVA